MANVSKGNNEADDKHFPGYTEDAFPELFDSRAMPTQPKELKPGQLPADQIREYFENVSTMFYTITKTKRTGLLK
jgi:hypothetical protein